MEIFKIIAIAICTLVSSLLIKNIKSEISILICLSGGILILLIVAQMLGNVFSSFNEIISKTGVSNDVFKTLLKVVGIGYITHFASSICQDAGAISLSEYVNLGGRVVILIICLPIFKTLLELVVELV